MKSVNISIQYAVRGGCCIFCNDAEYTEEPFKVLTHSRRVVEVQFNFCPFCGRNMRSKDNELTE